VVLTGPNGAGKTNLLEALSLLVPGRGLRGAKFADLGRMVPDRNDAAGPGAVWAVAARLVLGGDEVDIGTGQVQADAGRDGRVVKIDGQMVKRQSDLGRVASAQWLTPQMDGLFIGGTSERRRFVDHLIAGVDPDHAGPLGEYDRALRGRGRVLREARSRRQAADPAWLTALEDAIAAQGIAVAARRREMVAALGERCRDGDGPFPGAALAMTGTVEDWLDEGPAVDAEDRFRAHLAASRDADAESGGSAIGPHRSDLAVSHGTTGIAARHCSTGEQKALLVAIVLAAARYHAEICGYAPLLLLDEVAAHLDDVRRRALFETVEALSMQAWMTGTDAAVFAPLGDRVQRFAVADGQISPGRAART
jgi:DNA replication and repair protein RecF